MAKNNNIYSGEFGVNNQLYFCGVPFRLDSYSGCSHVCRYCLMPETKVLMADLTSKEIKDIIVGDKLVGFDENTVNNQRHLRIATVLATYKHQTTNLWEINTAKGKVFCTGEHPWLHARGGSWTKAQYFNGQGTTLRYIDYNNTQEATPEYKLGYIVGLFDAEGSIRNSENKTPFFVIGQALNNVEALYRLKEYLEFFGFENIRITEEKMPAGQRFFNLQMQDRDRVNRIYEMLNNRPENDLQFQRGWLSGFFDGEGTCSKKSTGGSIFISQRKNRQLLDKLVYFGTNFKFHFSLTEGEGAYLLGGTTEAIKFITLVNPAIKRKTAAWIGNTKWGKSIKVYGAKKVEGQYEVIDIETDTHTFIAEGFATHNCFARSAELTNLSHLQRKKRTSQSILPADPMQLKRKLVIALDQGLKRSDINIEWLRQRVPIHWGGMSDPFQPCENYYKVTKQWLEYFNWYNYPVAISTKGTQLATSPEYLKLLKEGNYVVQVSLITDDPILKQLEPGVPEPEERLKHIGIMVDAGIQVMVRIQPLVPNTVVEHKLGEYITRLGKLGVKHVLTEGYKVQVRQNDWKNEVWKIFPEAIKEYQAASVKFEGFELLLSSARKYKYVSIAKQAAHEAGMTYGAADNDMRIFGDTICCCGLDNIKGFENFWRYQASQAAFIAREKGFVTLDDMQQFWNGSEQSMDSGNILNNDMYMELYGYPKGKAKERNKDTSGLVAIQAGKMRSEARSNAVRYTAKYCVDWMWNNGGACSPENIVGIKKDNIDGKVAYRWQDPTNYLETSSKTQQISLF